MKKWIVLVLLTLSFNVISEVHTPHCLAACPEAQSNNATNDLIVRDIYTLSSNDSTKFTDWAAYKITKETIGSGCNRRWKKDPKLTKSETLEPKDYKGAHDKLGIDRGHQVPLASVCSSPNYQQANYLSNITPQKSELNQGPWKHLEEKSRNIVKDENIQLYVITGPLYERGMPQLPNATKEHKIPSGYWKVVSTLDFDTETIQVASFIMDQESKRKDHYCDKAVSLSEVETRSKFDLFPSLDNMYKVNEELQNRFCPKASQAQ
ncbi:DNA/RNA non-specific endonuclease [Vibrio atypicus]|uniref:DNA/RNA non-specific endonuclease n=1 Tax=Vibrio atypicus TaxID=558271 RepID=UPI003734FE45